MAKRKPTSYAASEGTQDDRAVKIIAAYGADKSARAMWTRRFEISSV